MCTVRTLRGGDGELESSYTARTDLRVIESNDCFTQNQHRLATVFGTDEYEDPALVRPVVPVPL